MKWLQHALDWPHRRGTAQDLEAKIQAAIDRAYVQGIFRSAAPAFDADPRWMPGLLTRAAVHEDDFRVFGHFKDTAETILDVGANYGYSAISIWGAGARAKVFSIEPIAAFSSCLKIIRDRYPEKYNFWIGGLGGEYAQVQFITPVVNNTALGALTSSDENQNLYYLARNIGHYIENHIQEKVSDISFYKFSADVRALDDLLREVPDLSSARICAIKIDTEGNEFEILNGMKDTLKAQHPLLMIENGSQSGIRSLLIYYGYALADRIDAQLSLSTGSTSPVNQFFVHPSRFQEYRTIGLLS